MRITRILAPLACIFILHPASFGYVRLTTNFVGDNSPAPLSRVDNTGIQFLLNTGVVPGLQSSASGKNVTVISPGSDPQGAIRAALASWTAVQTANITFLPLKSTAASIDPNDNAMVINVASSPNDVSAVGGALAITANLYIVAPGVHNGVNVTKGTIVDSDIVISPGFSFSTDGSTQYDLQSVITHELGHSLGANHTGLLGAIMFQQNSGQRFLTADDLTFANIAYPSPSATASLGTISGTVTVSGAPVPFGLLTAFDTSTGISVGGVTAADGTYSFQVPPGNYQIYAEPLTSAIPINIYLTQDQANLAAAAKFQTTLFTGTLNVAPTGSATANIAVTPGASTLASPLVGVSAVNAFSSTVYRGGPVTVPSGQSVDLGFYGAGFDSTLKDSSFAVYGPGIKVHPGSVRVDTKSTAGGFNLLRVTLDVDSRTTQPALASFIVTSGSNALSFSGALVIVPPTPTFVPAGVISAAPYVGIQGGVSPGGIYTVYDVPNAPNLGPASGISNGGYDAYGQLPTLLAGVRVTFDGIPAPMFYSSGTQLNIQAPFELAGKTTTTVVVNYLGSASAPASVPVLPSQPGFFTLDGHAVIALNRPSYTLNTADNPAPQGSLVEIYGTGVGPVSYAIPTGLGAPQFPGGFTGNFTYTVGTSQAAPALFGGWTVGSVGLAQWDFYIPTGIASGAVPIKVTDAAGRSSQPGATIYVK